MDVTLREIARITNFSRSTVAKVLRGHAAKYRISSRAEQKIQSAAAGMHYRPNKQAELLQRGSSDTIAFLTPSLSGLFFGQIIEGIERAAKKNGKHLILSHVSRMEEELTEIEEMLNWRVDGIILVPRPSPKNREAYAALAKQRYPLIFVNDHVPKLGIPAFVCDDHEGARMACAHLIELGHRRIGTIKATEKSFTSRNRYSGFRAMIREHHRSGVSCVEEPSHLSGRGSILRAATAMLRSDNPPTAFCCLNDKMALEIIQAVETLGLRIPRDVSIVGFSDDIRYADWLRIPLTTVRADHVLLGFQAANALFESPLDCTPPAIHRLPLELIIRSSTGPPPR